MCIILGLLWNVGRISQFITPLSFWIKSPTPRYGHVEKMEMRIGLDSKHEIIMYKDGIVDHKWVNDRNYVCLLHNYRNLCFCLHKYFPTFLFFIYN
jgi:hypothetical protein